VYVFLDRERVLIYVGKAANLRRRLREHGRRGAQPDDVRWQCCADAEAAADREADLIVALRPAANRSHATDGRWVYVALTARAGVVRLAVADEPDPGADRCYGCFPHLGVGVSSPRAIACSEGYAGLVRLVWAAGERDPAAPYPRAITGPSPPRDVTLPYDEDLGSGLRALLAGTSARVLGPLAARAEERRPPLMLPALRRDREAAAGFFAHGPRAIRALRLRHGLPPGPLSRSAIEALLLADLRAAVGDDVMPPLLPGPDERLVGTRTARQLAVRAERAGRG
jgi:hypothetical protein